MIIHTSLIVPLHGCIQYAGRIYLRYCSSKYWFDKWKVKKILKKFYKVWETCVYRSKKDQVSNPSLVILSAVYTCT